MKKAWLAALASLAAISASTAAHSQNYVAASAMFIASAESDWSVDGITGGLGLKKGGGASIAYGRQTESGLAFELELAHRPSKIDEVSFDSDVLLFGVPVAAGKYPLSVNPGVSASSLMASAVLNFDAAISPYFGIGLGAAYVRTSSFTSGGLVFPSDSETGLAAQIAAGVSFPVSEGMDVRLGYKYFTAMGLDFEGIETDVNMHSVELGALFKF
ncbi:MAG: outer membrane beta-barrel protein [Albidovulum sp.]|nr:outer membrane beta-barrel protein [Albidovulum sp.]